MPGFDPELRQGGAGIRRVVRDREVAVSGISFASTQGAELLERDCGEFCTLYVDGVEFKDNT